MPSEATIDLAHPRCHYCCERMTYYAYLNVWWCLCQLSAVNREKFKEADTPPRGSHGVRGELVAQGYR
jgi:hypothetical protein